tara:strand:- start:2810 stop:3247 length:438 start_codon:yes stop_codon:yes gene_type:complete
MVLDSFFDAVFGSLIETSPGWTVVLISFIFTLLITLAYKYFTDQEIMKSLKGEMKELRKEMKEFKDDPEKMMAIQKKSFEKSMQQMKMQFKPMLITLIPLLVLFSWLRGVYTDMGDVLFGLSWLWIYIISSIIFSIFLRKALKVH